MGEEPKMDARAKAEAAFSEWALRVEDGEALDFEEVIAEHPELESDLRRLHADWKLFAPVLGNVVPGLISDESGLVMPSLSHDAGDDEAASSDDLFERLGIHIPSEGRYRFRSVIGRGGGGVVLKVWDAKLKRPVAMKVVLGRGEDRPTGLTPKIDSRSLSRFIDEASIASQLNHPGIVPVHELGSDDDGRAFFTMKLVKGHDLTRIFAHAHAGEDGWSTTRALGVMLRVCEAMAYAHDKGVIHRDLKPANVMVGPYGDVQVMDWGLARVLGQPDRHDLRLRREDGSPASVVTSRRRSERSTEPDSSLVTMDGSILGTPCYMAPEQARGDVEAVGPKADVYAIGAMLYHLLAGHPPYYPPGERLPADVILSNLLHGPPRPLGDMTQRPAPELVAIAEKAMQRDPDDRYASMQSLADDLRAALEGRVVRAYETGTWAETKTWVKRNKALAASVITALVVATTLAIALGVNSRELTQTNERLANERDVATWRSWLATATIEAPDDAALRAMIVREIPETATDPWLARRAIDVAGGSYHRGVTLRGHTGPVIDAAWSPDGRRLASISWDDTARVWNADGTEDGSVLFELEDGLGFDWYAGGVGVTWSPVGDRIAMRVSGDVDGVEFERLRVVNVDGTGSATLDISDDYWSGPFAWSPDGERLAVPGPRPTVRVWDVVSGEVRVLDMSHADGASLIDWSPDGKHLFLHCNDGIDRIWNTESDDALRVLAELEVSSFDSVAWSPDGTHVLGWSSDSAVIRNIDGEGEMIALDHDGPISSAQWSADGSLIATMTYDDGGGDAIYIWARDGALKSRHAVKSSSQILTWVGESQIAVSDGDIWKLVGVEDGSVLRMQGHSGWISALRASTDGRLATAAFDGTIRVWNTAGVSEPRAYVGEEWSPNVPAQWSPRGDRIVASTGGGGVAIFDVLGDQAPVSLPRHARWVSTVAWDRSGSQVVTASIASIARVSSADPQGRSEDLHGDDDGRDDFVTAHVDGVVVDVPGGDRYEFPSSPGALTMFGLSPFSEWGVFLLNSASWSPDGRYVMTSVFDDTVARVWRVAESGAPLYLRGHSDMVAAAEWSPDGHFIATVSQDRTARIWRFDDPSEFVVLAGHEDVVGDVDWHPDGDRVVTAGWDGTARVWTREGKQLAVLKRDQKHYHLGRHIYSAAWSPDGEWILTAGADRTASIYPGVGGPECQTFQGHKGAVYSAAWSPDGRLVATASADGTARLWDAHTGAALTVLRGHKDAVLSAAWRPPDGKQLLTASRDGSVRVWTLDWPALRARLWDVIDDLLSPEERVRYLGETEDEALAEYKRQKAERDARVDAR